MGMFDYFTIDTTLLPMVPSELKVGKDGRFTFQTKDTTMQGMCTYIQERDHTLKLERTSGEWVPGEPMEDSSDFLGALSSLGSYVIKETWYEEQKISLVINFYTNLRHIDNDGTDRYADGWIEYDVTYNDGSIKSIVVTDYTRPRMLTDEEVNEKRKSIQRSRDEVQIMMVERRMKRPTNEELLIDSIDNLIKDINCIYDETNLTRALNNIQHLIEEYRERHDLYYRSPERKTL